MKTLEKLINDGIKLTPMMEQFYSIKKNYPDMLLLFRMGDFYELFFEDAVIASKVLSITLTHRGKIGPVDIPMAGIPHHAANSYIDRITAKGMKAAICEQIEDPAVAKGIVKRSVTQIVSPGMPYDLDKTDSKENYFISSGIIESTNSYYLVSIDFTTGGFIGHKLTTEKEFIEKIRQISPKEFICSLGQWDSVPNVLAIFKERNILVTNLSEEYFQEKFTAPNIELVFPQYNKDKIIASESNITKPLGALSYYICSTRPVDKLVHIQPFRFESEKGKMKTTASTLIGLEIMPKSKELYKQSLLGFFDKTKTAQGSRHLKLFFQNPSTDENEINNRLDITEMLINDPEALSFIRDQLEHVRDVERIMAKISTKKVTAQDLLSLSQTIKAYEAICTTNNPKLRYTFLNENIVSQLLPISKVIKETINDEIGATLDNCNLIKNGANPERDQLAKLAFNFEDKLLELEEKYKRETEISKIKVKYNNVNGYFIEISKGNSKKAPEHFIRKQTLVNAERYVTPELNDLESDILSAKLRVQKLEREIFSNIVEQISATAELIRQLGDLLAKIDIYQSNAWISIQENFVRPTILTSKKLFNVAGAWHPLIKNIIKDLFVTHDIYLDDKSHFGLITGPNMAGKTTVMREVAIIQILSQLGCFVPAKTAQLGICDYLFSRLGASDDITKGQSTFMVEMTESAEILRHATENSMIILDEIGRGTSTYDGLSIAWAIAETLVTKIKPLTLFATHYHELIEVINNLPGARNLTVETAISGNDVSFLYRLIEGGAAQSYGIYVAKLAGFPTNVLKRAATILRNLESKDSNHKIKSSNNTSNFQLNFFDTIQ